MSSRSSHKLPSTNQVINWDEFQSDCLRLANKIAKHHLFDVNYSNFYCIPRGGLTPAAVLAYELKIKNVRMVPVDHARSRLSAHDFIIDSLYDTGETYYDLLQWYGFVNYAFVYAKHNVPPDKVLLGRRIDTTNYLVFPWESGED